MDKIDIIMPVYNCEKYIKEAIQSVKNQTYANWRLIIIDDASIDKTLKIINEEISDIKDRVLLITNKTNIGVAETRNIGLENVQNRYIAFLDADDIWNKNKLNKQLEFMINNNYSFTYTLYTYLKNNKTKEVKKIYPSKLNYEEALKNTFILTSTVMIDSEKINKDLIKMKDVGSEDTLAWWNILKHNNTAYCLNKNLLTYRIGRDGLSANKFVNLKRTWKLYRKEEKLNIISSIHYFAIYVFHAIIKRVF